MIYIFMLLTASASTSASASLSCSQFSWDVLYDPTKAEASSLSPNATVASASLATSQTLPAMTANVQAGQVSCATFVVLNQYASGALEWRISSANLSPTSAFSLTCPEYGNTQSKIQILTWSSYPGISAQTLIYASCCSYSNNCNALSASTLNALWYGLPGGPALTAAQAVAWATYSLPPSPAPSAVPSPVSSSSPSPSPSPATSSPAPAYGGITMPAASPAPAYGGGGGAPSITTSSPTVSGSPDASTTTMTSLVVAGVGVGAGVGGLLVGAAIAYWVTSRKKKVTPTMGEQGSTTSSVKVLPTVSA